MLIPIVLTIYYNYVIEKNLEDAIYESSYIVQSDPDIRNFENDVDTSLILIFNQLKLTIFKDLNGAVNYSKDQKDKIPNSVNQSIKKSYEASSPTLMEVPRNLTFSPSRHGQRKFAKTYNKLSKDLTKQTNKSIKKAIYNMADNISISLGNYLNEFQSSLEATASKTEQLINENIEKTRIRVYNITCNVYYGIKSLKAIIDILFIIAIIKSFLYVLARVLFRKEHGFKFQLIPPTIRGRGELKKFDRKYKIHGQSNSIFYVKRDLSLDGAFPRISLPQFSSCIFRRFFNKAYFLDKVDMKDFNTMTTFSQKGGREFVEYSLKKNEKCVFHFRNFVGIESTVNLKTEYNFQLPSFLFEKVRFSVAEGPGKLILSSNGNTTITPESGSKRGISLDRIIGFQKSTQFAVESNLEIADVFFSKFHMVKINTDNIIIDSETANSKRSGIIRFFVRFLIPI